MFVVIITDGMQPVHCMRWLLFVGAIFLYGAYKIEADQECAKDVQNDIVLFWVALYYGTLCSVGLGV